MKPIIRDSTDNTDNKSVQCKFPLLASIIFKYLSGMPICKDEYSLGGNNIVVSFSHRLQNFLEK